MTVLTVITTHETGPLGYRRLRQGRKSLGTDVAQFVVTR